MNKSQYQQREKADVELYINDDKSIVCHDFCVSVAKAGSIDTSFLFFLNLIRRHPESNGGISNICPKYQELPFQEKLLIKHRMPEEKPLVSILNLQMGESFLFTRQG